MNATDLFQNANRSKPSSSPGITVTPLLSGAPRAGIDSELSLAMTAHERAVMAFATLQFFALIYLQKFALFPSSFPLEVHMLIMFASVPWMIVTRNLRFVASSLAVFLIFLGFCLLSESFAKGSWSSLTQVILLYVPMALRANVTEALYRRIMNRFIMLMILPAGIMIVQYAYQKLTGLSDPFNLEKLFPKSILTSGFFYNAHYPWNSTFSRPNGFFFLEPSFASAFTASAAILEISYFRRPRYVVLMVVATVLSMGATGMLMLVVAAPFLLARESPLVVAVVATVAVAALIAMFMLDIPPPMMSRVDELHKEQSSGSERMMVPAEQFGRLIFDPSRILVGDGAGSTPKTAGGLVWPLVKLLREVRGVLDDLIFHLLYGGGLWTY